MHFNPKVRNFKLKKLEKIDMESASEASQNFRINNIANIVPFVDERMIDAEGMLNTEHVHKRKVLQ
jgi:hypothetical protein